MTSEKATDRKETETRGAKSMNKKTAREGSPNEAQKNTGPQEDSMVAESLSAYYGSFKALEDVNMRIRRHKVTAFIGSSGCGKSTFVRCLNRMHEVASSGWVEGKVSLDGNDIYGKNVDPVSIRRKIGMVFQTPNPFPSMSVYDNVVAGLKLAGRHKKSHLDEVVEKTLKQAALWNEVKDKLKQGGTSLSGGQQQRLCIARTLAVEPEVILMDEPASSLDPISTTKIEDAMHELKKEYTVAIVTHNMQQASASPTTQAFST